jgi:hypothetical protein
MAEPSHDPIIARALAIIEDGAHWTTGAMARRADRTSCACFDPEAQLFCAAGALYRAACELQGANCWVLAQEAEQYILQMNGWPRFSLPNINDIEGHARVVAMFKKALGKQQILRRAGEHRASSCYGELS